MTKVKSSAPHGAASETARERILRAAARLYASRGFEGTSLRQVAEAAAVTKPLVLYHFESKERLFSTLLREAVDQYRRKAQGIVARPESAAERLRDLLRAQVAELDAAPEVMAFAYEAMTMPGMLPLGFDYKAEGRQLFGIYVRLIEEGQRRGEFRATDPRCVAGIAIATLGLYANAVLAGDLGRIPKDLGDVLYGLLTQGVEARRS